MKRRRRSSISPALQRTVIRMLLPLNLPLRQPLKLRLLWQLKSTRPFVAWFDCTLEFDRLCLDSI